MAESREYSDSGSDNDPGSDAETNKAVSKPEKAKVTKIKIVKPTSFYSMVLDALKTMDNKAGVSVIAIRSFILNKYTSVDRNNTKNRMRKALVKGLENGTIMRPKLYGDLEAKLVGKFRYQATVEKQKKMTEKAKAKSVEPTLKPKQKLMSKVKAKSKTAYKNRDKSALKTIKQTPAKAKTKLTTPKSKPTKSKSIKSNTPKKTVPKKNLIEEMEKEKKKVVKAKAEPKPKMATKKKSSPKKKTTQKKKTVSKKKAE